MTSRNHFAPTFALLSSHTALWRLFVALALILSGASIALAGPREQAARIHDRLAGVPADEATLNQMAAVLPGDAAAAANIAMNNPNFYAVTLKNFAAPWTNRDSNPFVPLNDYMTLVMGMVRDNVPFNQVLSGNLLYTGPGSVTPAASPTSNAHFEALEQRMREPNFNQSELVQTTQTAVYGTPAAATAGAITTRAAAEAFFIAGTNRAMFRFTLMNHMCMDMEQVLDTSIAPDRIRQDVSRSPGGDSRVFMNNCIGCHAGMDPMAQAFAYYNFDTTSGRMVYDSSAVHSKYFNNDTTFPDGFVTPNDAWHNHWRQGQNALIGWSSSLPGQGSGAKSLGEELAGTQAFAQCQVKKVFKAVCLRDAADQNDLNQIGAMTNTFQGNYNLKQVFAETAGYCSQGL
jgi:hypothetical protein